MSNDAGAHSLDAEEPSDDGSLNRALNDETDLRKRNVITLINTNARSLAPKIESLIYCFGELEADVAVVTSRGASRSAVLSLLSRRTTL